MLVSIPTKLSVAQFMGYLKGKSALMMFDKHANQKYKFGNRHFGAENYHVSTVGLNEATIKDISKSRKSTILQWINLVQRSTKTHLRVASNTNTIFNGTYESNAISLSEVKASALRRRPSTFTLMRASKPPVGRVAMIKLSRMSKF